MIDTGGDAELEDTEEADPKAAAGSGRDSVPTAG